MNTLIKSIEECRHCHHVLPLAPNPVVQLAPRSKILIIGQAPGRKAHETGKPFNDPSGTRLKEWLGVDNECFYQAKNFSVLPMAFCYPGKGSNGDLPPPKICEQKWHARILDQLKDIELTLLLGQYSQQHYLKSMLSQHGREAFCNQYKNLTERVKHTISLPETIMCLPHPSPRNQMWLKRHTWFEQDILPVLRHRVHSILETL